jgi:hypothetical protein
VSGKKTLASGKKTLASGDSNVLVGVTACSFAVRAAVLPRSAAMAPSSYVVVSLRHRQTGKELPHESKGLAFQSGGGGETGFNSVAIDSS